MNITNISSYEEDNLTFSWYDYTLFVLMLLMSALIGVYFGFIKKQTTVKDYLFGGKEMTVFPISMSLIASSISGITLLAVPADVYRYGIMYWFGLLSLIVVTVVVYYFILPVYYELQVTSTFEYLEKRFDKRLRIFASFLFTFTTLIYLPIVIYVPALALSQGTNIPIHSITPIICGICIFYTTFGGLKAVVWTDALQFVIMIGAIIAVFILGVMNVGGLDVIWNRSKDTGRTRVDFDYIWTKRDTFWATFFGMGMNWMCYIGTNQGFVQKCIALPKYKDVRNALIIFLIGMVGLISVVVFTGLIIYATYHDCDPIRMGQVKKSDQILPHYVIDVASSLPGLPGVFIAGVFSASLSTLSAVMNCLAATIYEDFISPFVSKDATQEKLSNYLKLLAVAIGIVSTVMVYVIEHVDSILQIGFSIGGMTSGTMIGIFGVGLFLPQINSDGTLWGGIISLISMVWIISVARWNNLSYPTLDHSMDGCTKEYNQTDTSTDNDFDDLNAIYRMSYYYYAVLGLLILLIVSPIASYIFKRMNNTNDPPVDGKYLSPIVRRFVEDKTPPPDYYSIETAKTMLKLNENI